MTVASSSASAFWSISFGSSVYFTFVGTVSGINRRELREFFEAEVPDELGHATILADKIVTMGGRPTVAPAPVKYTEDAKEMLRNSLEDEAATVERYVQRREQAEACGEYGLAVDFDDLIRDETRHRDELRMMLKRWT